MKAICKNCGLEIFKYGDGFVWKHTVGQGGGTTGRRYIRSNSSYDNCECPPVVTYAEPLVESDTQQGSGGSVINTPFGEVTVRSPVSPNPPVTGSIVKFYACCGMYVGTTHFKMCSENEKVFHTCCGLYKSNPHALTCPTNISVNIGE